MNSEYQQMLAPESENQNEVRDKQLVLSDEIVAYLNIAARWGKFLAILGFIFTGLIVFGGIIMSIVFSFLPSPGMSIFPFPAFLIGFIYLVMGIVYFFPALYLFRFSSGIESAFRLKDQNHLTKAFYFLKAQYRYFGIFMIIILALYLVIFVVAIFTGLFASVAGFPGMHA